MPAARAPSSALPSGSPWAPSSACLRVLLPAAASRWPVPRVGCLLRPAVSRPVQTRSGSGAIRATLGSILLRGGRWLSNTAQLGRLLLLSPPNCMVLRWLGHSAQWPACPPSRLTLPPGPCSAVSCHQALLPRPCPSPSPVPPPLSPVHGPPLSTRPPFSPAHPGCFSSEHPSPSAPSPRLKPLAPPRGRGGWCTSSWRVWAAEHWRGGPPSLGRAPSSRAGFLLIL